MEGVDDDMVTAAAGGQAEGWLVDDGGGRDGHDANSDPPCCRCLRQAVRESCEAIATSARGGKPRTGREQRLCAPFQRS